MLDIFDLQLFAEEAADEGITEEQPSEVTEGQGEATPEPVPPELSGLSEESVKAIMDASKPEPQAEEATEAPSADTASDNKQDEGAVEDIPKTIPYKRFKQKVDEANELRTQIGALQQQLAQAQQYQQPAPQQPAPQPQPQAVNPAVFQQIDAAARQMAKNLTGLSDEDVAALEYADDGDARKSMWQNALGLSRYNIFNNIQRQEAERQAAAQEFMRQHEVSVQSYNAFAQEKMQDENFEAVKHFAINDFFSTLPQNEQQILAGAYARIERQTASPQDTMMVMNYYKMAEAAFKGQQATAQAPAPAKPKARPAMPRAQQVRGGVGAGGGLNAATLESIMQDVRDGTKSWRDVDPEYKAALLGASFDRTSLPRNYFSP